MSHSEFYEKLVKYSPKTLVIVDVIQKLPELLDYDHKLMVENGLSFILSGSSARKIIEEELTYWHTYNKDEVDAVIGDARIAIEIKSTDHVETKHKKGLQKFAEEHPYAKQIIVSRDFLTRRSGDIDIYYVTDFFKALWNGEIL